MTILGELQGTITIGGTDYTLGGTGTPGICELYSVDRFLLNSDGDIVVRVAAVLGTEAAWFDFVTGNQTGLNSITDDGDPVNPSVVVSMYTGDPTFAGDLKYLAGGPNGITNTVFGTCSVTPGGFRVYMPQSKVNKLLQDIANGKNAKAVDVLNAYAVANDSHYR